VSAALRSGALDVSRETQERLDLYLDLLSKWNRKINLVSPTTVSEAWTRHILDSAQIFALRPTGAERWTDLGSGGGFPGMVIAMLARGAGLTQTTVLIESDTRKATFLRTVARETGTPAVVLAERIERADPQNADVVSARALAPLPKLLEYVARHCDKNGTALLLKGAQAKSELSEARESWHFQLEESPSLTDSQATVLKLRELRRV
jgi:16S rRNA (guanine527-N7)-methyltransferase